MINIGKMPYLNSEIFYLKKDAELKYITLTPREMGKSINMGHIDAGPISLVDFMKSDSLKPLKNYCVSTKKYANSVYIFSKNKISEIKNIYVTNETSTSVMLMKVLNQFYWKNDDLKISNVINTSDSQLLIGDKALKLNFSKNDFKYVIDLGYEWYKFTSLPFVFAIWAHNNLSKNMINILENCINFGLNNYEKSLKTIIAKKKDSFFTPPIIERYINGFNYELTEAENNAITTFKELYNKLE
tara:strand:+ start:3555 stop:4283 length:729 start_codon:yes stop_codon:yes gene_type:complete